MIYPPKSWGPFIPNKAVIEVALIRPKDVAEVARRPFARDQMQEPLSVPDLEDGQHSVRVIAAAVGKRRIGWRKRAEGTRLTEGN